MTVALAPETLAPRPAHRHRRPRRSWRPPARGRAWGVPAAAVVVLALWGAALPGVRSGSLPPVWFAAFGGAVLLALAVLLSRRPRPRDLAACELVLLAVLPGTAAVAGVAPAVPAHLAAAFPGARLPAAPWLTPVLALVTAAAVHWLAGAVSRSPRVRWGAVLLATLGAGIATGPAPQAAALPVSLVLLGGLLRTVPPGPDGVRWAALRRLPARRDDVARFWSSRWGALVLVLLFALVAVTDLAAAGVLLAQVAAVCALLRPARPWLALALLAVEEAWLLRAWPLLHGLPSGAAPVGPAAVALVAVAWLLAAGAVAVALSPRRRDGRVVVPAVLALLAVLVAAAGRGDGGLPAGYLLALPHLATAAALVLGGVSRPSS